MSKRAVEDETLSLDLAQYPRGPAPGYTPFGRCQRAWVDGLWSRERSPLLPCKDDQGLGQSIFQ